MISVGKKILLAVGLTKKQNVVAIVTDKKRRILSIGLNSYTKTHPYQKAIAKRSGNPYRIYLHAEVAALVKCRKKPHTIYIVRMNRKGETVIAKPCETCRIAIQEAGIKKIIYTK